MSSVARIKAAQKWFRVSGYSRGRKGREEGAVPPCDVHEAGPELLGPLLLLMLVLGK